MPVIVGAWGCMIVGAHVIAMTRGIIHRGVNSRIGVVERTIVRTGAIEQTMLLFVRSVSILLILVSFLLSLRAASTYSLRPVMHRMLILLPWRRSGIVVPRHWYALVTQATIASMLKAAGCTV